jgi:4-deoxy-L-threo-5-hexosulose-uronate ketol-isomerase
MTQRTMIDMRQVAHPRDVRDYNTEMLRADFLIEGLFASDEINLTFSHIERMIVGGVVPVESLIDLPVYAPTGTAFFLERRELGVFNVGGAGTVHVDGAAHELERLDAIYIGLGTKSVRFSSKDASDPARFYLLSTPAHQQAATQVIRHAEARKLHLGSTETANVRTLCQYLMPDMCGTNQLVMGLTMLAPGSVWNTMPAHTHDRRSEAYLYFDLGPEARVFHMMGEPSQTRHLVVANEQAILSPNWSIHSGCGTSNYSFIWGMGGDNVTFTDMDPVAMADLR